MTFDCLRNEVSEVLTVEILNNYKKASLDNNFTFLI